jgi:hypothetical protein
MHGVSRSSKTIMPIVFVVALSVRAWAAAPICSLCQQVDGITKQLQALNYSNQDDNFKGKEIARDYVLPLLLEFGEVSKAASNRIPVFNSLLSLLQAAAPYDGEGALMITLAGEIRNDATLKSAYAAYTKTLPQSPQSAGYCNAQLLVTDVTWQTCMLNAGMTGQDTNNPQVSAKAAQCKVTFNYDTCLASAPKK